MSGCFRDDEDESSISVCNSPQSYLVISPWVEIDAEVQQYCKAYGTPILNGQVRLYVRLIDGSTGWNIATALEWLTNGNKRSVVCGLDTESGTSPRGRLATLQLCVGDHVVIFHRNSGAFDSPALKDWFATSNLLFTGMGLTTDARE